MTVLAVASQKGGVGKTTVALNIAYALARRGFRTALVDMDPQGAIGLSLAGSPKDAEGLFELVNRREGLSRYLIKTRLPELSLLTFGKPDAATLPQWIDGVVRGTALKSVTTALERSHDLVVVDSPPGTHGLARAALEASTHVLVPLQSDPLALRSLPQLIETLGVLRAEGAQAQLTAVVLTMTQFRDATASTVAQEAWSLLPGNLLVDTHIPRDPVFAEASAKGVPVGLLHRRPPPASVAFDHLAAELEERIGLSPTEGDDDPIHLVD